jgi:hypothetical protein
LSIVEEKQAQLIYLVAAERADELVSPLREHFADEPRVEVVVDRRERKRAAPPRGQRLRHRAPVAERDPARTVPDLPIDGVRLVQPLEPVGRVHEATSLDELVTRSLAAEPAAVSELWWRTGERVMTRLRLHVGRRRADRSTGLVLGRILDELPAYDPQDEPLEEWLDDVVDRFAHAA